MKNILDLMTVITYEKILEPKEQVWSGVTTDSRKVTPGSLFICLRGHRVDGHRFAKQAVAAGASAIITEEELDLPGVTQFVVQDSRCAMQVVVPYFYDYPGQKMRMIGVTGTNGKTTVTHMIARILSDAGHKVGIIGTVHVLINGEEEPINNTTPDVDELQNILYRMHQAGITHVVMEVSSHALVLDRVAGCEFDTAVFTNLTQDHLDFHGSMDEYGKAKLRLFKQVASKGMKSNKHVVINLDDPYGRIIQEEVKLGSATTFTYGIKSASDFLAKDILVNAIGSYFTLVHESGEYPLHIHSMGMFNIYNSIAAIAAAKAEGITIASTLASMANFEAVPGRFERVDEGQDFAVVVDYAHTPDGLVNILKTAREMTDGRILIAFGCGGDRDKTKRPIMGNIAAQYADIVMITSDNPRTEDPEVILQEVKAGAEKGKRPRTQVLVEVDRKKAIQQVIQIAGPGDVVLIAGKGHETYQIIGNQTVYFDDRECARSALRGE